MIYACICLAVVMSQRDRVLDAGVLFNWKEFFKFNVESDDELMYKTEEPDKSSA